MEETTTQQNIDNIEKNIDDEVSLRQEEHNLQDDANKEAFSIPEGISDYAKKLIYEYSLPAVTSTLESEDKLWEKVKTDYIKKYENEEAAKEAFSKVYAGMSDNWQKQAEDEYKLDVLESMEASTFGLVDVNIVGDDYEMEMSIVPTVDTGKKFLLDGWTRSTKSKSEATQDSKTIVDAYGNVIEYEGDPYDIFTFNDDYTNKDGKMITHFVEVSADEYSRTGGAPLKAVYEGEHAKGYVVSRWDTSDSWLKANGLDTSTLKVSVGSTMDFFVDTADTVLSIFEHGGYAATIGYSKDTLYNRILMDSRAYLSTIKQSKSEHDRENIVTLNNAVNMGINVALQLASARWMASAGAKIYGLGEKAAVKLANMQMKVNEAEAAVTAAKGTAAVADLAKEASSLRNTMELMAKSYKRGSNIVKRSTLFMMGAMQAKDTGDMALKNGFTPFESSLIYFASLGSMAIANKISDLGFERLELSAADKILKETAEATLKGVTKKSGSTVMTVFNKFGTLATDGAKRLSTAIEKLPPLPQNILREGTEEQTEYVLDQVVRHGATALAHYGYKEEEIPKFKTMFEEGYWEEFWTESLLNIVGGAFGGMLSGIGPQIKKSMSKGVKEEELPFKGTTAEIKKQIAFAATRGEDGQMWEAQYLQFLKKGKQKGAMGRNDISDKWDSDKGRYKRMNELTEEEKKIHHSQAEIQYEAAVSQYMYYRHIYSNSTKKLDELVKLNPEFNEVVDGKPLYEETRALLEEKASIYSETSGNGEIDFDAKIKELSKLKSKIKVDEEGNNTNDEKYLLKTNELASATKLPVDSIVRLVAIEDSLTDIKTGKILETAFVKHLLGTDSKYKDLSYDDLKELIEADVKAKDSFSKQLTEQLAEQSSIDNKFSTIIKSDNTDNQKVALIHKLISEFKNSKIPFMSSDIKAELRKIIDGAGTSLNTHKVLNIYSMLEDLKSTITADNNAEILRLFTVPGSSSEEIIDSLLKTLRLQDGHTSDDAKAAMDSFSSLWSIIQDNMMNDDPSYEKIMNLRKEMIAKKKASGKTYSSEELQFSDELSSEVESAFNSIQYIIKKIDAVQTVSDIKEMDDINYDPFNLEISDAVIDALIDSEPLFGDILITPSEKDKTLKLGNLRQETDEDIIKEFLNLTINAAKIREAGEERADLLYSFSKNDAGKIVPGEMSLYDKYFSMTQEYKKDSEGKLEFYSDLDGALDFQSQVKKRKVQLEFVLEILPTLRKIHFINQSIFDKKPSHDLTFVSEYINKNIVTLEHFDDNAEEVYNILEQSFSSLIDLESKADDLVNLAKNISSNLEKAYIKDAIELTETSLNSIHSIITSTEVADIIPTNISDEIISSINELDFKDASKENVAKIFSNEHKVRRALNKLYASDKTILNTIFDRSVKSVIFLENYNDLVLYSLSNADIVYNKVKALYTDSFKAAESDETLLKDLKLPTLKQIRWAEIGAVAATNSNYLKLINLSKDQKYVYNNALILNGRLGTGKSEIISNLTTELIQELQLASNSPTETMMSPLFTGDTEKRAQALIDSKSNNVSAALVDNKKAYDRVSLYKLFKDNSVETLKDKLASVNTIIYDEISLIEFIPSEDAIDLSKDSNTAEESGELNLILSKLEEVNKLRKNSPIILIGLGDSEQGGYIEGMPSARNKTGGETLGDMHNATTGKAQNFIAHGPFELEHNFRSIVAELSNAPKQIINALSKSRSIDDPSLTKLTLAYDYNQKNKEYFGVKTSTDWITDVLDNEELVNSIEEQIKKNPKFKVLIVSGETSYDNAGMDTQQTRLGDLMKRKKDNFETAPFYRVQGEQANYTLFKVPDKLLPFDKAALEDTTKAIDRSLLASHTDKIRRIATIVGRSTQFTHMHFNAGFDNITSVKEKVTVTPQKENDEFKLKWGTLLIDSVLGTYDGTVVKSDLNAEEDEVDEDPLTEEEKFRRLVESEEIAEGTILTSSEGIQYEVIEILDTLLSTEYTDSETGEAITREFSVIDFKTNKIFTEKGLAEFNERQKAKKKEAAKKIKITLTEEQKSIVISNGALAEDVTKIDNIEVIENNLTEILSEELTEEELKDGITIGIKNKIAELTRELLAETDILAKESISDKLLILKNAQNILLGIEPEFLYEEINQTVDSSGEIVNMTEEDKIENAGSVATNKDIMKLAEEKNLAVMFSHIGKDNLDPTGDVGFKTSLSNRMKYIRDVYGEDADKAPDIAGNVMNAIGLGKDGLNGISNYTYSLVSYEYSDNKYNHALIATKKPTLANPVGAKYLIAQFGAKFNYTKTKGIYTFLQNRESLVNSDGKIDNKVKYVESNITAPLNLILGTTTGGLVSGNEETLAAARLIDKINKGYLNPNMRPGKLIRSRQETTKFTSEVKAVTDQVESTKDLADIFTRIEKDKSLQNDETFPFVINNKKYIRYVRVNGSFKPYIVVKTSKGDVPFVNASTNSWLPILGITESDGVIVVKDTIKQGKSLFDYEFKTISNSLSSLNFLDYKSISEGKSTLKKFIAVSKPSADVATLKTMNDISVTDINDILEISEEEAREGKEAFILKYRDKYKNFFGNTNLPLNLAQDLWEITGKPKSTSTPYVITEGKNIGKAVVFYTFRNDINLESASEAEIIQYYKDSMRLRNKKESVLTDNRDGIGQILLDPKKMSFKDLVQYYSTLASSISFSEFNKMLLSGNAEMTLIKTFATVHKLLNKSKSSNKLVDQILDGKLTDKDSITKYLSTLNLDQKAALNTFVDSVLFNPNNTGRLVVTTDAPILSDLISKAKDIENLQLTSEEEYEELSILYDSAVKANPEIVSDFGITNPNSLKYFTMASSNASGILVTNKQGKAIIKENKTTIVSMVDAEMMDRLDPKAMPKPRFNMYKLLNKLHTTKEAEKDKIVEILSGVLESTVTFRDGIYASPLIKSNGEAIAKIKYHMLDKNGDHMLRTTVKQVRAPAVVLSLKELTSPSVFVEQESEEAKRLRIERESRKKSINTLKLRLSNTQSVNGLDVILKEINSSEILVKIEYAAEKKELIELLKDKYKANIDIVLNSQHKVLLKNLLPNFTESSNTINSLDSLLKVMSPDMFKLLFTDNNIDLTSLTDLQRDIFEYFKTSYENSKHNNKDVISSLDIEYIISNKIMLPKLQEGTDLYNELLTNLELFYTDMPIGAFMKSDYKLLYSILAIADDSQLVTMYKDAILKSVVEDSSSIASSDLITDWSSKVFEVNDTDVLIQNDALEQDANEKDAIHLIRTLFSNQVDQNTLLNSYIKYNAETAITIFDKIVDFINSNYYNIDSINVIESDIYTMLLKMKETVTDDITKAALNTLIKKINKNSTNESVDTDIHTTFNNKLKTLTPTQVEILQRHLSELSDKEKNDTLAYISSDTNVSEDAFNQFLFNIMTDPIASAKDITAIGDILAALTDDKNFKCTF